MTTRGKRPGTGSHLGAWTLLKRLGRGGNAEVWRATDGEREVALKILNAESARSQRYRRFATEIQALVAMGNRAGILPIISHELTDRPTREHPAWLAMPIATPIRTALGGDSTLEEVAEAISQIATTLAGLAAEGITHRDIKPENLYQFEGRWCVGDFGLVEYPNKEALTAANRRLGPLYYHAPECLLDPGSAGEPSDVFSLAKTLWVLATRSPYPLQGYLQPDIEAHRLESYVPHPRNRQLELLIGRATHPDPAARPTLGRIAAELSAWLRPDKPAPPPALGEEFRSRVSAIAGVHREALLQRERSSRRADALIQVAEDRITRVLLPVIAESGFQYRQGGFNALGSIVELAAERTEGQLLRQGGPMYTVFESKVRGADTVRLDLAIGVEMFFTHQGRTRLVAFLALSEDNRRAETLWSEERTEATETALEDDALAVLLARLSEMLPTVLSEFISRFERMQFAGRDNFRANL